MARHTFLRLFFVPIAVIGLLLALLGLPSQAQPPHLVTDDGWAIPLPVVHDGTPVARVQSAPLPHEPSLLVRRCPSVEAADFGRSLERAGFPGGTGLLVERWW